jgi:hypothetical protein
VVFPAVTKTNAFKLTLLWDIVFLPHLGRAIAGDRQIISLEMA